jgi:hypothetical protein
MSKHVRGGHKVCLGSNLEISSCHSGNKSKGRFNFDIRQICSGEVAEFPGFLVLHISKIRVYMCKVRRGQNYRYL